MPAIEKMTTAQIEEVKRRTSPDSVYEFYYDAFRDANPGDWFTLRVGPDEDQKLIKSRLTKALKRLGVEKRYEERDRQPGQIVLEILSKATNPTSPQGVDDRPLTRRSKGGALDRAG